MQEYRKLQERTNEDLVKEYQTTHNENLFRALLEKNTGLLHIIVKDDVRGLDCDRFSQIEVDEYLEGLEAKDRYMVTLLLMGYSLSDCAKAFHVANSSITWRIKRIRKNYTAYSMAV